MQDAELIMRYHGLGSAGAKAIAISLIVSSLQFAHLFAKLPRPGDSEVLFAIFRVKLPPVNTSQTTQRLWKSH